MRIVIGSAFRNSAVRSQITPYFSRIDSFSTQLKRLGHSLRMIAVEGDSVDNTRMELMRYSSYMHVDMQLVTRNHGCREWGSTEEPERLEKLCYVGDGIVESVQETDDVFIYVESDLIWRSETFLRIIDKLKPGVDCISPLIFARDAFYDIWGFRKNGRRFEPFHPYHPDLNLEELTELDSAGSCLIMRAEVARNCRFIDKEALVGFSRDVRAKGYKMYCDPTERIHHP